MYESDGPRAGRVVSPEVTPPAQAEFPHRLISHGDQLGIAGADTRDVFDHRQHVDHRLGVNAGDGRAADVVDVDEVGRHRVPHFCRRASKGRGPGRIMGNHRNSRRH
ncbi:MAG: hypothetical protein JWM57_3285 [Phycisphaerales bacterium]|nr:hypothetical protein [Phycisphaerales bacterium]